MMTELAQLEVFLRGGAVATFGLCAALFAARSGRSRKDVSISLLSVSLCAYLVVSSPSIGIETGVLFTLLVGLAAIVPVLAYWAALEFFQDDAALAHWQLALCAVVIATALLSFASQTFGIVRGLSVFLLFGHVLFVVATGAAGDLVEARRRFRRWFLLAVVLVAVVITALEITGTDRGLPLILYLGHAAGFWALAATFVLWATRVDPAVWPAAQTPAAPATGLTPADTALIKRIEAAMTDGLWQQEGLTVSQMAQTLDTQEHRLRKAINQGLGHRNFASFVNLYRIGQAQKMLRDPLLAERTVLSIAYDVGFASLGPFNRAFRRETGMSPTEFRSATLAEA